MKKILTIAALFASIFAANAQIGIMGGFSSSRTSIDTKDVSENTKNISLYHVGVLYKFNLGMGFAVQPSLAYQMKGATLKDNIDAGDVTLAAKRLETKTGFIELGAGLQWGMDLLAFRPFVFVEPFVGYGITGTEWYGYEKVDKDNSITKEYEQVSAYANEIKNKLEYGFGVGGGVEIANHVQISVQWFKNLGNLYNEGKVDWSKAETLVAEKNYKNVENYSGIKVTLGILF